MNPGIQFFLEGVVTQCENNIGLLNEMVDLYERSKSSFSSTTNSSVAIAILDFVFESPIFTIPAIQQKYPNISKQTLVTITAKLKDAGIFEQVSVGKGRRPSVYRFNELVDLLS